MKCYLICCLEEKDINRLKGEKKGSMIHEFNDVTISTNESDYKPANTWVIKGHPFKSFKVTAYSEKLNKTLLRRIKRILERRVK